MPTSSLQKKPHVLKGHLRKERKKRSAIRALERYLEENASRLFRKQYRGSAQKLDFHLRGSFAIGTGSAQVGNKQHLGKDGFLPHPFRNTAVYVKPVEEQKGKSPLQKEAYRLAHRVIRLIDKPFSEGEYMVQFSLMNSPDHYVKKHTDAHDITFQYNLVMGNHQGAFLRTYDAAGAFTDIETGHGTYKVIKFDGRLPHEVVLHDFQGTRYTAIWFKNYDHRMTEANKVLGTPRVVHASRNE